MPSFEISSGGPHRLADVDWSRRFARIPVFGAADAPRLDYVRRRAESPADRSWRNICESVAVPVSDVGFYFCRDVELRWPGLAHQDGELLDYPDIHPKHLVEWRKQNCDASLSAPGEVRHVSGVSLLLPLAGYDVYGHWILDFLPRAWLFSRQFGYDEAISIVLPVDTPAYAIEMLQRLLPNPFRLKYVFYNIAHPVRLERAIIPSLLHNDYCFHPAMNWFVRDVLSLLAEPAGLAAEPSRRVYVSRSLLGASKRPRATRMLNEVQLQQALQKSGLATVHPEAMKWSDQLALFAQARIMVGEGGSGLHNCLFAPLGARVVCLNPNDRVSAGVCALRGQQLCVVQAEFKDEKPEEIAYTVNVDEILEYCSVPDGAKTPPPAHEYAYAYARNFGLRAQLLQSGLTSLAREAESLQRQRDSAAQELEAVRKSLAFGVFKLSLALRRRFCAIKRFVTSRGERATPLFDEAYYFQSYRSAWASGMDGYSHYLKYGAMQGLKPNASFDTVWYLANYPDVARSGLNPLDHYYRYGRSEGRASRPG